MDSPKTLGKGVNRSLLTNHLLGVFFVVAAGYQILVNEFQNGKFVFYFYEQDFPHAPSSNLFVVPLFILIIVIVFSFLFYFFKLETNLQALPRRAFSSGFLVYLFFLVLTLEREIIDGAFYWPIDFVQFPYKGEYARFIVSAFFLAYYYFSIKVFVCGNRYLGKFNVFLLYSPVVSILFSAQFLVHIFIWVYAAGIIYISEKLNQNSFSFKEFIKKNRLGILIFFILLVSMGLRFLTINYFELLGFKNVPGIAADGPHSYKAAWSFITGVPEFSVVPYSYSFLLFILLKISSLNLMDALALQSFISCAIPLVVFFICRKIFSLNIALIALIISAFSYELLHFSVITHRTAFASCFLLVSLFILIKSINTLKLVHGALFGFVFGWTVLLEGLLAPLIILSLVPLWGERDKKKVGAIILSMCLGFLVAELSFNIPIYGVYKTIMPLGRLVENMASWFGNWIYGDHEVSRYIKEIGFNPFDYPSKSLEMFLGDPIGIGTLIIKKIFYEVRAYFLGRNAIFLDPFFLQEESYFSSGLSLFFLPIFILGFLAFVFSKTINWKIKIILALPLIYHLLFHTVVVYSYARYRGVVLPIIIIFFSYGVFLIFRFLSQVPASEIQVKQEEAKDLQQLSKYKIRIFSFLFFIWVIGFCVAFYSTQYINPPVSSDKTIVEKNKRRFLWKDQKNQLNNFLASSKGKKLFYDFYSKRANEYDIYVKFSKEFGPSLETYDLVFYLNKSLVGTHKISENTRWVKFERIQIEEGKQTLSVHAKANGNKTVSFTLGRYPKRRNIKLMDLIIKPS